MSKMGRFLMRKMESSEFYAESWSPHEGDYSPHDWATSQPEWNATLGKCLSLIMQVLREQKDQDIPAWKLYSAAEEFAVDVIAHNAQFNLEKAYKIMGYPLIKNTKQETLPF